MDEVYQHITQLKSIKQDEGPLFSDVQDENFIPLKLMFKELPKMRGLPLAKLLNVRVLKSSKCCYIYVSRANLI